jgi:membrane-associated phospholipid phosphatase
MPIRARDHALGPSGQLCRGRCTRALFLATVGQVVVLVGVSRICLGVHRFTGVTGYALGVTWLTVLLTVRLRRREDPLAVRNALRPSERALRPCQRAVYRPVSGVDSCRGPR